MGRASKVVMSVASLGLVAAASVAEDAAAMRVGARVRVTAPELSSRRLTGTLTVR